MQIYVLGLSYKTAPLELREKVAFRPDETRAALARLRDEGTASEIALLSTCNRTEFYTVAEDAPRAAAAQIALVRDVKGVDLSEHSVTYLHRRRHCVEHLFRVAGGLDSMVLGEPEILGQVKDAFQLATESGASGDVFGRLFPSAFRVGKRSRTETGIGRGAVSLAKAGVQLAEKIFGDLRRRSAVVVGAGTSAEAVARLLHERPLGELTIANRTVERAAALASRVGGRAVSLEDLPAAIARADVLGSAASAPRPIVRQAAVGPAIEGRRGPLLVIDLGVPRNVEPDIRRLGQVFLYAVDDLQELVNRNLGRRRQEIPAVESIVADEVERFFGWMTALSTAPIVKELRDEAERLRRDAIERLGALSPEEQALVEKFSVAFMNKLLHAPTVSLRDCDPETYCGLAHIAWTRRMFGLGSAVNGDEAGPKE